MVSREGSGTVGVWGLASRNHHTAASPAARATANAAGHGKPRAEPMAPPAAAISAGTKRDDHSAQTSKPEAVVMASPTLAEHSPRRDGLTSLTHEATVPPSID